MRSRPALVASQASLPIPAGSFLRHNPTTFELELVGRDGAPLAPEAQRAFFAQLPEVTVATLKVSILYCT